MLSDYEGEVLILKNEIVWLTGLSQSGTTLLLALMDGHPSLITYPVEPSFGKLFKRSESYFGANHLLADFFFGTPNNLHYYCDLVDSDSSDQVLNGNSVKGRKVAVKQLSRDEIFSMANRLAENKHIKGLLPNELDHKTFFLTYNQKFFELTEGKEELSTKAITEIAFEALRGAIDEVLPELTYGKIKCFKQPSSTYKNEIFDIFYSTWPNGKIIYIYRNPYARLYSRIIYKRNKDKNKNSFSGFLKGFLRFIWLAYTTARDSCCLRSIKESDKLLKIEYESLVLDPSSELNRISNYLNIPHYNFVVATKLGMKSDVTTNRTGENAISKKSINKWEKNLPLLQKYVFTLFLKSYHAKYYLSKILKYILSTPQETGF